jgi:ribosomal protein S18 acetylase RimI-like enzyme
VSVDRIEAFRRALQRAAATRVVATSHGTAILADPIPDVYDANYLSVEAPRASAAELAADAERALEDRHHRRVIAEDGTPGLADDFAALDYSLSTHLVLQHTREPDRTVDTGAVREVSLDELTPARTLATLREPWGDDEIARQLDEAKRLIAAAVPTRFFATVVDGSVAGWCELRVQDGVAQIEDVEVLAELRGRGLGRALVTHALEQGRRSAEVVFLEALADDWPRELYAKLGFTTVGRRDVYTRLPHPLTRVRLRTPRLELRVPTVAEARRIGADAALARPNPERLLLVAFLDGAPVGVHGPGESWLASGFRGVGLEDELQAVAS